MNKKVVVKIKELTQVNHISLRKLSEISNIRLASLSELANGKRESMSFSHIEKIAAALNIQDIREIIDLVDVEEE
ncbi:helix-turn-helix transcriptional regulator [Paenibacillus sp. P96]|uniref:Helix-turn-helix transcriptional regulator n=1 Tax=Paenibacillus zeirhizosphaerae TaxID=2987519 RepID=A0ABT9FXE3_9BACL|nr:helix-turn-helix transcriptional regulator [Paenibacillus sp. P96]MDP4099392.1 helix-turn-helix transcriptional regulator [Paenibacillus sp. P96]